MIKITNKDNVCIYVHDRSSDIDNVLKEFELLENGKPYPEVFIDKYFEYGDFKCTKIKYKELILLVFDDRHSINFNGLNNLIKILDSLSPEYILNIDETNFHGKFRVIKPNLIKDASGKTISTGLEKENISDVTSFIYRMKKDNGQIISPLTKRFSRTGFIIKNKRAILGYAHLPTYIKMLKDQGVQGFTSNIDNGADYMITLQKNNPEVNIRIIDKIRDIPIIKIEIPGSSLEKIKKHNEDPYLLMYSKPIEINKKKLPYFIVMHGKTPTFVSIISFSSSEFLEKMKGGIDLLKM